MADEPNDLVLRMLQDIRLTLDQHSKILDEHSQTLRSIDKQLQESKQLMTYTVGMASMAQLRPGEAIAEVTRMQALIDELKQPK